jgi:hypothetical protein
MDRMSLASGAKSAESAPTTAYEPPRLRRLGSVADLTQGGVRAARSDGILYASSGGGWTVNGS